MTKINRPNFEAMSLFQLMVWAEERNFTADYDCIVSILPDFNPFEPVPDSFTGTTEEWYQELDELEAMLKDEYVTICLKIYIEKLGE